MRRILTRGDSKIYQRGPITGALQSGRRFPILASRSNSSSARMSASVHARLGHVMHLSIVTSFPPDVLHQGMSLRALIPDA